MKFSTLALGSALAGLLLVGTARAQSGARPSAPVQNTAFDYGDYYSQDPVQSPSDQPPAAANAPAAPQAAACNTCNSCNTGNSCGSGCGFDWPCDQPLSCLGTPCRWSDSWCCCKREGFTAAGWLEQSFTANFASPSDRFNGPVTWTDRSNDYQMNELYYYVEQKAKTDQCDWDYGYRADALWGTNYRWNTETGLESHLGNGKYYGLAVPQFYIQLGKNDWDIKIGHFISPVGFYTVGSPNNFFPVIPYTYQYGEPFTHTGVLANKKVNDQWVIGGGITHGWDNFDNTGNPHAGAIADAIYTINEKEALAWVGVYGEEPNVSGANGGFSTRYFQTVVYSNKISDDIAYYLQSDFGVQGDATFTGRTARWYGVNQYLYWNQTCRFQWGLNAEWFRDEGGFRVGNLLPSTASPNAAGWNQGSGFDGSFYALTFGPRYYFTPNMYTRVAFRADWYDGKRAFTSGNEPFDAGRRQNQQLLVFDLVYTF